MGLTGEWVNIKDEMPSTEIECLVAQETASALAIYKKFVQWNGETWVDIDGETVTGVRLWSEAPHINSRVLAAVDRLEGCLEHDTCEQEKCRYFAHPHDMLEVLEYIKKMEGIT